MCYSAVAFEDFLRLHLEHEATIDIEAYEASCLSTSTKSAVAENVAA